MQENTNIILTQNDFEKISALIMNTNSETAKLLDEELGRAEIVDDQQLPTDVVAMNSKVSFLDLETNKESVITLVYPHEANIETNKLSILAPIGAALIGLRVGQEIEWPVRPGVTKKIKVVAVAATA